ncbi:MAG TPA: zinc metallopeptidase [Thermoleophilia bacterium]|nr:zinc metallopeptidase [Thermoleophilia bacterium]HQJ27277.1 zinc metallopeptidase [Thermoleophilia bacterium]
MDWSLYILFFGVPLILGLAVQGWLRSTFSHNSRVPVASGMTGADVARRILDANGLQNVPVRLSRAGALSDHYDPRGRTVNLSEPVFSGRSVAATAVAAHEVGHAIQHARSYVPMTARSAIWPLASIGSQAWFFILLLGLFFNAFGLVQLALVVFALVVLFQVVTLPVEFNASRRAMANIRELGLVSGGEAVGARRTLTAAAMTYVAAALTSIAQLLYFLMAFGRN